MAAAEPVSETEIESTLHTDPDYAIELLDTTTRSRSSNTSNARRGVGSSPMSLCVAYQETMLAFIEKIREEGFDHRRPLRMVYCIAKRKGFDQLRSRRHRMNTNADDFLGAVAASLKNSEVGARWTLITPSERKNSVEIVLAEAAKLPERQKIVATCYIDCFEIVINEGSFRALAEEVSRVTGKQETVAAVKSAWHVAKKRIAQNSNAADFNFITVE